MPRNQGTSRKGRPGKLDRLSGLGKSLQKKKNKPIRHSDDDPPDDRKLSGHQHHQQQSILELHNLDDFLMTAEFANREFESTHERLVVLDATALPVPPNRKVTFADDNNHSQQQRSQFSFRELSIPRRPAWDASTTKRQLEINERNAFIEWRRQLAHLEEQRRCNLTPFEKNLEVWRQLWRVLERSQVIVQIVDARNIEFYCHRDLAEYAQELGNKPTLIVVNKSDYLTRQQRKMWLDYLKQESSKEEKNNASSESWSWNVVFFSAAFEQQVLDGAAREERRKYESSLDPRKEEEETLDDGQNMDKEEEEIDEVDDDEQGNSSSNDSQTNDRDNMKNDDGKEEGEIHDDDDVAEEEEKNKESNGYQNADDVMASGINVSSISGNDHVAKNSDVVLSKDGVDRLLSRDELMDVMLEFANAHQCPGDPKYDHRVPFGMVGFPNVGKSSVINVLVGSSQHSHNLPRVGVASQPGKTKHFQTLVLPELVLCDCPGLVFPSLVNSTADLLAAGVYPISQMRDPEPVVELICQRIPRSILNALYGIHLPVPSQQELCERNLTQMPPPTAEELLTTFCVARSLLAAASGVPDYPRAARIIVKDYANGKLLYCHPPPNLSDSEKEIFARETMETALQNTEKLKAKLFKQQQKEEEETKADQDISETTDEANLIDEDLLELIGASAPKNENVEKKKDMLTNSKKGRTPKQKWGKKDRKNRNKDPYGCHTNVADETLFGASSSVGVTVSRGRFTTSGYTRPTFPVQGQP
jgi:large subunit GTPase 1